MGTRGLDWLFRAGLFLLPLVSGAGTLVSVAGLAPVRPLVLGLVLVAVLRPFRSPTVESMWILVLALGWLGWGFLLPQSAAGISEMMSVGLGLAAVWAVLLRPVEHKDLKAFIAGWVFAWGVSILPAIYEIATGKHLPNYLEGTAEDVIERSTDIASFFVNPNLFAYFMVVCMVMLAIAATLAQTPSLRSLLLAGAILTPLFIHFSGSRITLAVSVVVLLWILSAWWPRLSKGLGVLVVAGAGAGSLGILFSRSLQEYVRVETEGSGAERLGLYLDGAWMIDQTWGLGVGAGGFEPTLMTGTAPFDTGTALNPHSGVFEIASQYGILVAAVSFAFVGVAIVAGWGGFSPRIHDLRERVLRQSVFVLAVMLPVQSFANSTFLDSPIAWAHVAILGMLYGATKRERERTRLLADAGTVRHPNRRQRLERHFASKSDGAPLS